MVEEKKPVTGAQMQAEAEKMNMIARAVAKELKVREWCVEQAVACGGTVENVQNLTQYFYNFVTDKGDANE